MEKELHNFWIIQLFFIPVVLYFMSWTLEVWKDPEKANFKNTMRMIWLASTCTNLAFITLLILNHFG
jgi:1,4-dihydroxy-2-naphthoate octaprenyltransferase